MIAHLLGLGWEPLLPTRWADDLDSQWEMYVGMPMGVASLLARIQRSYEDKVWKEAAHKERGRGLEEGRPDVVPTRRLQERLCREGRYIEARICRTVVAGGTWSPHEGCMAGYRERGGCDVGKNPKADLAHEV